MAAKINRHRYETIIASLSTYVFTAVELESTGLELRFHLSLDRKQFVSFQKIAEQFVRLDPIHNYTVSTIRDTNQNRMWSHTRSWILHTCCVVNLVTTVLYHREYSLPTNLGVQAKQSVMCASLLLSCRILTM